MFHKPVIAWVVGLSCVAVISAQPGEDAFRPLAKNHRWFELRGTANAQTSPLVRGAAVWAFSRLAAPEAVVAAAAEGAERETDGQVLSEWRSALAAPAEGAAA